MYVTQQVISKQIKHLEKEIGFDLFKRDKRNVILTEGGEILYAFWVEYFDKYEKNLNKANAIMNNKRDDPLTKSILDRNDKIQSLQILPAGLYSHLPEK